MATAVRDAYASRHDTIAFLVCLLLAIVARAAPEPVTRMAASGLRQSILVPFLFLQQQTELIRSRRADYDILVARRDSSVLLINQMLPLQAENARLRRILGLGQRLRVDHVAAEVLHQLTPADGGQRTTMVLSAGARQGVREWAPVVVPDGLIGFIWQVDQETSVAIAWTHASFRASALVQDSIVGIVEPRPGDRATTLLQLTEVAETAVLPAGSPIVTSGSGIYPAGIPLGYVRHVIAAREGWSKTYLVEPAVHPASVSHVLILLTELNTASVAGAFAPTP